MIKMEKYLEKIRESLDVRCLQDKFYKDTIIVQLFDRDMLPLVPENEQDGFMEKILEVERTIVSPIMNELKKEFLYALIDKRTLLTMETKIKCEIGKFLPDTTNGYKRYIQYIFDSKFKGKEIQLSLNLG